MRKNWVVDCENISEKSVFQEHAKKGNVELISAVQSDGFRSANVIRASEDGVQALCEDLGARGITCCVAKFTSDDFDGVLAESANATLRLVGAVFHEDFDRSLYAVSVKKFEDAVLGKIVTDPRDIAFFGIVGGLQIVEVSGGVGFPGAVAVEESDLIFRWFGFHLPLSAVALKRDLLYHIRKCVVSGDIGDVLWIWKQHEQPGCLFPGAFSERIWELQEHVCSKKADISVEDDRNIEDIVNDLRRRFEEYGQSGVRRNTAIQRDLAVFRYLSDRDLVALAKRDLSGFGDLDRILAELRERWKNSRGFGLRNAERVVNTSKKLKDRLVRLIEFLGEGEN